MEATENLKSKMLRLLKEDEEFRYAVAGLIGMEEILKRLDRNEQEIARLREDMMKVFEKHEERFARLEEEIRRIWQEIERLREDMNRGFERHDREIAKLREDMNKGFELMDRRISRLENLISALGARWGMMAEDAFRNGLRGILEKELGLKVERWIAVDEEGMVYGFRSVIEVDIAIKDGKTMLIEISSSVDQSKVAAFVRKAKLYEKRTGVKPDRLVMVTPYADERAMEAAKEIGVEIYTRV